jgi:ABC-type nitrate/sulfonate/bicarbonate transport system substrate-binding protein
MQQKSFLSIMAILFLGFGLASAGELRRVRVGITDPNISVAPFYLAKAQNYYSSEGLDVDLIVMRGPVATLALLAGELEFTAPQWSLQNRPLKVTSKPAINGERLRQGFF